MAYQYNLKVVNTSFDCCGSATVGGFYGECKRTFKVLSDKEGIDKLMAVEVILTRERRNLGVAVLTHKQVDEYGWRKYLDARGWTKVGQSVQNQKTLNMLEIWMLDMTNRKVVDITPPPAPPVNAFDAGGVRLDRRNEPRSAEIIGRSTVNDHGQIKEYFMDINNHRVEFVDLPIFNRGQLLDRHLTFSSIRLVNGGGSYSWLQGGTHRFPQPIARPDEGDDDF
jgi:hypothetical protein